MYTDPKIFLSNRVEQLYENLIKNFFENACPFAKRILIVPSPAMKTWVTIKIAEDPRLRVCMGIEVHYLEEGLNRIYDQTHRTKTKAHAPSHFELSIRIEVELKKIIATFPCLSSKEKELWRPLINYLKVEAQGHLNRKNERRLIALSEKLAHLFKQYGRYGGKMLDIWEKEPSVEWQAELWKTIFCDTGHWTYLYRQYHGYLAENSSHNLQLHLFAISFMSHLQMRFVEKMSKKISVNHYVLSPCSLFWSDICSDKQRIFIQQYWQSRGIAEQQQKNLEELLKDRNPLLANFGRLGREVAKEVENTSYVTEECYTISAAAAESIEYQDFYHEGFILDRTSSTLTLLDAIQADMLLLRNPSKEKKINLIEDQSIQVHIAPNKLREVEILYDNLMQIIANHREDANPIVPSDMIVLTPEILDYEPYIKAIFKGKNSQLDCQMMDLKIPAQSQLIQAFLHLLSLPQSRWDTKVILQLFEYPAFRKKHKLSFEDIQLIRSWIKDSGILWGENSIHRDEILTREHCQKGMADKRAPGTWEHGFERLVNALIVFSETLRLDFSQSEVLGKFSATFRSLSADLMPLLDQTQMTLEEWSFYLKCLLDTYFMVDSKDTAREEEYRLLTEKIAKLSQVYGKIAQETFRFTSVHKRLEASLFEQHICYRENYFQTVKFCSMLPMRAIPSRVVVLLGLIDGVYPKQESDLSLNAMQGRSDTDYCPKQIDYDRYLFLEMLLSARHYLILSYSAHSSDGQKQAPSLLVDELMSYLDDAYTLNEKTPSIACTRVHPFHSFDSAYFDESSSLKSYIRANYEAAQAFYLSDKIDPHSFIHDFALVTPFKNLTEELNITTSDLVNTVKNPLKIYFNESLKMYLKQEEEIKAEEDFCLSPLESSIIKKASIRMPLADMMNQARDSGQLPLGLFGDIAARKVQREAEIISDNLKRYGITSSLVFNIHISDHYDSPLEDEGTLFIPAITIPLGTSHVKITGVLESICSEGMIVYADDKHEELVKFWPQFILLSYLINKYSLSIKNQMLPVKSPSGKAKGNFSQDPEIALQNLIKLCMLSKENPSPLSPEWILEVIKEDPLALNKKLVCTLNHRFKDFYNAYMNWALPKDRVLDAEAMIKDWKEVTQTTFNAYYQTWYPELLTNTHEVHR